MTGGGIRSSSARVCAGPKANPSPHATSSSPTGEGGLGADPITADGVRMGAHPSSRPGRASCRRAQPVLLEDGSGRKSLPYIDRIVATVANDLEAAVIGVSNGEYTLPFIAKEEFFTIGITPIVAGYTVVQNRFRNVLERMTLAWVYAGIFPYRAEQYFIVS